MLFPAPDKTGRMTRQLLIASLFLVGCATTSGAGGGGGGSKNSGPFQGKEAVEKRRKEIFDASKAALDCMKVKQGEATAKGGIFAVTAAADGKLSAQKVQWDGPQPMAQCIVDAANKTAITPLAGPPVGALWEFWAPGIQPKAPEQPSDMETKMQALQNGAANDVDFCYQNNLPPDFPVDIAVAFFVTGDGNVYAPTVVDSNSKDGGYDSCVLGIVSKLHFPTLAVEYPLPVTLKWHRGKIEKL
jgi:hypothetical protein